MCSPTIHTLSCRHAHTHRRQATFDHSEAAPVPLQASSAFHVPWMTDPADTCSGVSSRKTWDLCEFVPP